MDVRAGADAVWRQIVDSEAQPQWLGGFRFDTPWEVGGAFGLVGLLNGVEHRETGTLLVLEPARRLRYEHWSALWRVPDRPENRAVFTLTLAPTPDGCVVALHHELPAVEALPQHAAFFWRGALFQLGRLAEGA